MASKIQSEITEKIKKIELEINENFEKKEFLEVENLK